jgi:peptide/nickel transport system substrate-binding protein
VRGAALLAVLSIVSALLPSAAPHAGAAGPTTLTVAFSPEPDTLDPQTTGTAAGADIDAYIGDTLVALAPNKAIVPDLAQRYTVSRDGLLYAFSLRHDVTFQDGTPLDAAAYVATFKRLLAPTTGAAVQAGRLGSVAAVTATGKYAFTLRLARPYPFLLYQLTDSNFVPLSPAALKAEGSGFGRRPVSTGPWQVQQWQTGSQIVLVRNPRYHWGPSFVRSGPPAIDKLVFRILLNPAATTAALQSGEVDEVLSLPTDAVQRILTSGQYTILKGLNQGARFMELNVTRPPFTDVRVRRALSYAIDRQAVVQIAVNGLGVPLYGVLAPSMNGYWPGITAYGYHYDPAKARALLAQAGYVKQNGVYARGGKPLSFTLLTSNGDPAFPKAALVIQDQLRQLGIAVTIVTQEFATEIATVRRGGVQADLLGYNYPIPDIFYIWFHSSQIGDGFADSFYRDPALDALIVKMRTTVDDAAREALIVRLEKYIVDRALWATAWDGYTYTALQPRVKGAFLDPRGRVILNNVSVTSG